MEKQTPTAFGNSNNLPATNQNLTPILDNYKSMYYMLNAKPDSDIRIFDDEKIVELYNIHEINKFVTSKLANHSVETSITSISFILDNKELLTYSNWQEFSRGEWDIINYRIKHMTITWDFSVKLPTYEIPQRHTLKLRVGAAIPPKDILQVILTSDDESELLLANASATAKIDFVNQIIATELLDIVQKWYEGLSATPKSSIKMVRIIKKYNDEILGSFSHLFPILSIILFIYYLPLILTLQVFSQLNLYSIAIIVSIGYCVFKFTAFLTRFFVKNISNKLRKLKPCGSFKITKGDKNEIEKNERENRSLSNSIKKQLFVAGILYAITFVIKYVIEYFT